MPVVGTAVLDIIPSIKGLSRELNSQLSGLKPAGAKAGKVTGEAITDGVEKGSKGVSGSLQKALSNPALVAGAAGLGTGLVAGFKSATDEATKLEQSVGGVDAVFKGTADSIHASAKDMSDNIRISQNDYNELATIIGSQLKNGGTSMDQLAGQTKGLIETGADMSAMFGGTTKEAVEALSSALKGEMDPIERYGVSLSAAKVGAEAAAQGAQKVGGQYSEQAKQAAILSLITKQTADAQGAAGREANTAAAKQEALAAKMALVKGRAGEALLPLKMLALNGISAVIDKVIALSPQIGTLSARLGSATDFVKRHSDAFKVAGGALAAVAASYAVARTAMAAYSGVVSVGRAVMAAYRGAVMLGKGAVDAYRLAQVLLITVQNGTAAAALRERAAHIGKRVAMVATTAATKSMAVAQKALNLVMRMNPIGLVVTALIGLGVWLVKTYKTNETFRRVVNNAWDSVKATAGAVWAFLRDRVLRPMGNFFTKTIPNGARAMSRGISGAWDATLRKSREVWNGIRTRIFDPMGRFMTNTIPAKARAMRDGFGRAFDSLKKKAADPINVVINKVWNDGLRVALGKIPGLDSFKGDNGKAAPIRLNTGGIMPGYTPGRDVHRFVSPTGGGLELSGGEAIMRPEWTRAVGTGFVNRMNAAARAGGVNGVRDALSQKFSTGGVYNPVPGRGNRHGSGYPWATWSGDFPVPMGTPIKAWKDGVVAMVKHLTTSYGKHTRINHTDGSSSLYAHQSAIHVSPGQQVKGGQVIGLVGSTGNSSGPHLHFETMRGAYSGGSGDSGGGGFLPDFLGPFKAATNRVKGLKSQLEGMGSWGKTVSGLPGYLGEKVLSFGKDKIKALASSVFDAAGDARAWVSGKIGGSGVQRWRGVATEAAKAAGLPLQHMDLLMHRMNVESGGNPNAQNNWDINARNGIPSQGLMQTIPPTFRAYAGPYVGKGIRDPFANIYAAIRYTLSRYGLSGIGRAWGGRKGYANGTLSAPGGWAMVGERGPELVRLPTGSQVKTAAQTAAMTATPGPQRVTGTLTLTDDSRAVIDGWIVDMIEDAEYARNRRTF